MEVLVREQTQESVVKQKHISVELKAQRVSHKRLQNFRMPDTMYILKGVPFREILQRAANGDEYAIRYVLLKYRPLILSVVKRLYGLDYLYTTSDLITMLETDFIMSLRKLQCIAPCNNTAPYSNVDVESSTREV